mgnify:CR=1 FL=1
MNSKYKTNRFVMSFVLLLTGLWTLIDPSTARLIFRRYGVGMLIEKCCDETNADNINNKDI